MTTLAVLLIVAGVVLVAYVLVRRRAAASAGPEQVETLPGAERPRRDDVRNLALGDVVQFEGRDVLIRETYHLVEDGFRWKEHRADGDQWFSVEEDDRLEVAVWTTIEAPGLEPGPLELTHDGVTYRRREKGEASFSSERLDGESRSGSVEYVDYAAGDRRLSFERFTRQGDWEVSVGRRVNPTAEMDIYPSSLT